MNIIKKIVVMLAVTLSVAHLFADKQIAEKPSQLREYVRVLGGFVQKGDFYESKQYIASCALGHLIELAEDTAYRQAGNWDKSYLPLLPALGDYVYEPKRNDEGRQAHHRRPTQTSTRPTIGHDARNEGKSDS